MRNLVYRVATTNWSYEAKTLAEARQVKSEHKGAIITPITVEPEPKPIRLTPKQAANRVKAR